MPSGRQRSVRRRDLNDVADASHRASSPGPRRARCQRGRRRLAPARRGFPTSSSDDTFGDRRLELPDTTPLMEMNASSDPAWIIPARRRRGAAPMTSGISRRRFRRRPRVLDATHLEDAHVSGRSDEPIAQLALQARHQRQRDQQRHHADSDAEHRNERDQRDERLLAPGERGSGRRRTARTGRSTSRLLSGTHEREQDDVADRRAVGQQHHEAIDADAFAGRSAAGRTPSARM